MQYRFSSTFSISYLILSSSRTTFTTTIITHTVTTFTVINISTKTATAITTTSTSTTATFSTSTANTSSFCHYSSSTPAFTTITDIMTIRFPYTPSTVFNTTAVIITTASYNASTVPSNPFALTFKLPLHLLL